MGLGVTLPLCHLLMPSHYIDVSGRRPYEDSRPAF